MATSKTRTVSWFSCGAASAVATKLALTQNTAKHDIAVVRIVIPSEHPDNDRFAADAERWFGQPIINVRSTKYTDTWDVWQKRRYLAGIAGAPCTLELKKAVRWTFETEWQPDYQVFGYTMEERDRAADFRANNPEVRLLTPLIDGGLSKSDCLAMIDRAGIALPAMYALGYRNNNCIGCVKGGVGYWNKIRRDFPEVFQRMALLERDIGATVCKDTTGERERIYLDELNPALGRHEDEPDIECSLMCAIAESKIGEAR